MKEICMLNVTFKYLLPWQNGVTVELDALKQTRTSTLFISVIEFRINRRSTFRYATFSQYFDIVCKTKWKRAGLIF